MNPFANFKSFSAIYAIIFVSNLILIYLNSPIYVVTKLLIALSLLIYYIVRVGFESKYMIIALGSSILGDGFLLSEREDLFIIGASFFILTHLMYALRFRYDISREDLKSRYGIPVFLTLATLGYIVFLKSSFGDTFYFIIFYAAVECFMVCVAYLRDTFIKGYTYVYIGALLFIASNLVLVYDRFQSRFSASDYYIMSIYMVAQFSIVIGIVAQERRAIARREAIDLRVIKKPV